MEDKDRQIFYQRYKFCSTKMTDFDTVKTDSINKATVNAGGKTDIIIALEKDFETAKEHIKKMIALLPGQNLSFDQIGICLAGEALQIRSATALMLPRAQRPFYSRAYFLGGTWKEALNELTNRLLICKTVFTTYAAVMPTRGQKISDWTDIMPQKDNSRIDPEGAEAKILRNYNLMKIAPDQFTKEFPSIIQKLSHPGLAAIECAFLLDVKFLYQMTEYKQASQSVPATGGKSPKAAMKIDGMKLAIEYIMVCDSYFGTSFFDKIDLQKCQWKKDTAFQDTYYEAFTYMKVLIREFKKKMFGGSGSNPRREADFLEGEEDLLSMYSQKTEKK